MLRGFDRHLVGDFVKSLGVDEEERLHTEVVELRDGDEHSTQTSVFADCINARPQETVQKKGPVVQDSNSGASAVPSHTAAATAITSAAELNAQARFGSKLGLQKQAFPHVCTSFSLFFLVLGVVLSVTSGRNFDAVALFNWIYFRGSAAYIKPNSEAASSGSSDRAGRHCEHD